MSGMPAGVSVSSGRTGAGTVTWSVLMHVGWRAFLVGTTAIALLGALVSSPLTILVVAPVVGVFGALQTALVHPGFPSRPAARRVALLSGFGWALVVPFVMGIGALGALGAVLSMFLMLLGTFVLSSKVSELCRSPAAPRPGVDAALLSELVRGLPTSALLEEWRSSEALLHATDDPAQHAAAIQMRALLLEEMAFRDPVGVERWLQDGAGGSPDMHERGNLGPTAD